MIFISNANYFFRTYLHHSFLLQGKTFSAEATSEFVRRPLYVVGGGDLGTTASNLDRALQQIFDVATAWKAIVLIDEVGTFPRFSLIMFY